jgi:hypothetical protein
MLLWTKQDIIAISLVLCLLDLVVLRLNDKHVMGGDCLFRSSTVTSTFFGSVITHSYLHQVALKLARFFICWTPLIVNQQGPLIRLLRMKSSSMLWLAPNRHSKVFPVKFAGRGGCVAGYLIFKNLCSPWEIGISKAYFLETNLHLKFVILLNLDYLS